MVDLKSVTGTPCSVSFSEFKGSCLTLVVTDVGVEDKKIHDMSFGAGDFGEFDHRSTEKPNGWWWEATAPDGSPDDIQLTAFRGTEPAPVACVWLHKAGRRAERDPDHKPPPLLRAYWAFGGERPTLEGYFADAFVPGS
jgi:hypothetical protein